MLRVDVDDSIESYSEPVLLGLDLYNSILAVIAVAACGIYFLILVLLLNLPILIFSFTCWLPASLVFLLGRKQSDGVSIKTKWLKKHYVKSKTIDYISTESREYLEDMFDSIENVPKSEEEEKEDVQLALRQLKIYMIFVFAAFIVIILLILWGIMS